MRAGGSKAKGSSFEREVSVGLSKWISQGEREDLLWRSAMSGGRATVGRKKGTNLSSQAGDLSAVHSSGQPFLDKFYCELKSYKDLQYAGILTGTGYLVKFWNSTVIEANNYKKHPMLIAKQNQKPTVIFLQVRGLRLLRLHIEQSILSSCRLGMYGFLFEDFIRWAQPL